MKLPYICKFKLFNSFYIQCIYPCSFLLNCQISIVNYVHSLTRAIGSGPAWVLILPKTLTEWDHQGLHLLHDIDFCNIFIIFYVIYVTYIFDIFMKVWKNMVTIQICKPLNILRKLLKNSYEIERSYENLEPWKSFGLNTKHILTSAKPQPSFEFNFSRS